MRASRTGGSCFFTLRVFAASVERSRLAMAKAAVTVVSRAEATRFAMTWHKPGL